MNKPIVAIVGRPNVGKSTFFNRIAGKRISIVEDTPGVTRDRVYADVSWLNHDFVMIDTGGIEPKSKDVILAQMRDQAQVAIDSADIVIFMVDGREEYTLADEEIAMMLRRSKKPIILTVNKIDTSSIPDTIYDFYNLGLGEPIPISSVNALNLGDLLDLIVASFKSISVQEANYDTINVALIGKPNVGKSSLINAILGSSRVIVSNIAGTTREAIDTPFERNDQKFTLIDTAGLRKKSKVNANIEKYSVLRALTAIERSHVCLIVIDATEGVTEQDKKVAGYAHEAGKGIVIVVNKWDLIQKENSTYKQYEDTIKNELAFMTYAPIMFVSALTKQRLDKLLEKIIYVFNQNSLRISTGLLNDIINEAILLNQPPSDKGKRLKIYYMTQSSVQPPTFITFVNDKELAHFGYLRYLENQIRKNFIFAGTPIRMKVRQKNSTMYE